MNQKPSAAFIAASWASLCIGAIGYNVGLWRSNMLLNEKGYYFTVLMFGLLLPYPYKNVFATDWKDCL